MDAKVQYRAPFRGGGGYGKKGIVCTFWLQGRCTRNPCRFVHGEVAKSTRYTYHRTTPYPQTLKQASREDRLNSKKSSHKNGTYENESHLYPQESSISYGATAKKDTQTTCDSVDERQLMNSSYMGDRTVRVIKLGGHKKAIRGIALPVECMNGTRENESHRHSQESSICSSGTSKKDSQAICNDVNECQLTNSSYMGDEILRLAELEGHKKAITGIALPVDHKNEIDEIESHQHPQKSSISSGGTSKKGAQVTCNDVDKPQCFHSSYMGDGVERLAELKGHKNAITGIALPVGSQKLYTGSGDGVVRVWDCHTGQCDSEQNLGYDIGSLISEGPWMFVGLRNVVRVGNIQTASEYNLDAPFGQVYALETSGKDMLFAGMEDGSILIWKYNPEADAFQPITNLKGHTGCVLSLKVGKQSLYSGSVDNTIRKWDLEKLQCSQTLSGHSEAVTSLLCWESFLFSCSLDRTIKVWTITEVGYMEAVHTRSEEHGVLALFGMFDSDNKPILFSSQEDNSVHLYELPNFIERGKIFGKQEVGTIESGPGGLFFTGDGAGGVAVWRWLSQKDSRS